MGGDLLVDYLSGMLDDDSSVKGARNIVLWLQPGIYNPSAWVKLFQRIMSRMMALQ